MALLPAAHLVCANLPRTRKKERPGVHFAFVHQSLAFSALYELGFNGTSLCFAFLP